jgi:MFS family permease
MPHQTHFWKLMLEHYLKLSEAPALYLTHFIRTFALSLPGIFIPIFIFRLANKPILTEETVLNNLLWIVLYYLGYAFLVSLIHFLFTDFLFSKLTFKYSIFSSLVFLIGAIICFALTESGFGFLFIGAVLCALSVHFYWIPFHIFFVRKANQGGNFGQESATQLFLVSLASALGPLTAGLIIKGYGFELLFLLTILLLFFASVPVLFFVHETAHRHHSARKIFFNYILNPEYKKITLAFAGNGAEGIIYEIFWPTLLFLVLADFVKVGALVTISIIFSSLIILWAGRQIENQKTSFLKKGSVVVNSLLYLPRIFLTVPWGLYAIDIVDRLNGRIYNVSFITEVYDKARAAGESNFIIYREIVSHLAQFLVLGFVVLILFFAPNWKLVFLLAGLASVFSYFVFDRVKS